MGAAFKITKRHILTANYFKTEVKFFGLREDREVNILRWDGKK